MSATNPFTPPRADLDVAPAAGGFSTPRVWSARGRLGRLRYLAYSMIGYVVCVFGAGVIGAIAGAAGVRPDVAGAIGMLALIPYFLLLVLALVQRSHDMGWSGWTALACLIPFVAFVWLFKAGTPGPNRFGAPPPPNTTGIKIAAFLPFAIAILGIVAAIALPAYQQYTVRAKAAQVQPQP